MFERCVLIAFHAFPLDVEKPQFVLSSGMVLGSAFPQPANGLLCVFFDATAGFICFAE